MGISQEKRKNGSASSEPQRAWPRLQWWLLLVGILIGVLLAVALGPSQRESGEVGFSGSESDLLLTATRIIEMASATAASVMSGGDGPPENLDPLAATATAIARAASEQGAGAGEPPNGLVPLAATATAIMAMATAQAGG